MENIDFQMGQFQPSLDEGVPDERTEQWIQAARMGFNNRAADANALSRAATDLSADQVLLTDVHVDGIAMPIGTFAASAVTVCLGSDALLDAALISWVSVRSTHKRQGILRQMMLQNLDDFASNHVPIALLTPSEAGIYGRFGFETVIWDRLVEIDRAPIFKLRQPTLGRVEIVELDWLRPQIDSVFNESHKRYLGSISRGQEFATSIFTDPNSGLLKPSLRAAAHFDESDYLDGYVYYHFKGDSPRQTLEVLDIVAGTSNAELALWNFLANTDLAEKIVYNSLPVESVLAQALVDPRAVDTKAQGDFLWARVLDPIQVFANREYTFGARQAELEINMAIDDPLGYCTGTYRVAVFPDQTQVSLTEGEADLQVSERALALLAFGTASVRAMVSAGMINSSSEKAIQIAESLFAKAGPASFMSHF